MATPVEMPKLGNTVEECLLAKWKKGKGDKIANGEIIAEIETDKATFELGSPVEGTLLEIFIEEGALVPVYTNICAIGEPGENVEAFRPAAAVGPVAAQPAPAAPPVLRQEAAQRAELAAPPSGQTGVSPRARRYARDRGFMLPVITGTGPGGRVLEQDLKDLYARTPRVSSLARKNLEAGYEARRPGSGINGAILAGDLEAPPIRMSGIRGRIARRMRESLANSAQYTLHTTADATGLLSLRQKVKAARKDEDSPDVNINDMVMFATVKALGEMPELNAELIDGSLYRQSEIHLGFACDTEKGLLVAVVRDCQRLSLTELSQRVKALTRQVQDGTISADDLTGATFTVSNLGNLGIESFTPIINPPQVALLGVDSIELKPVRRDGRVEFIDHIGLSLTCDHQVIDGAPGARFLKLLREKIEAIESIADLKL
jgi:pyruvate dehydrogenase E2 component (dihydrolipoamide acetyltransferase)